MPEGHSVHRIANQFERSFVGHSVVTSSPQGRFSADATLIDGATMVGAKAVGKQMFLEFDNGLFLHVHLGLYGSWDFAGEIATGKSVAVSRRRRTGTRQAENTATVQLRMGEQETLLPTVDVFPLEPIGQVRVRILTDSAVADLRGPTKCEVLDAAGVDIVLAKLGPDPLVDSPIRGGNRFVATVAKKRTPIGLLLMDQTVISGIGNIYRAELLFRARLDPHVPGNQLSEEMVRALWKDWTGLLKTGVETGMIFTMDDASAVMRARALRRRADRYWVYHREGLYCRMCGTNIVMEIAAGRKLYYCPVCQG